MEEYIIEEEINVTPPEGGKPRRNAWRRWLRVMGTPAEGWHRMEASALKPEALAAAVFYPLTALASASVFMAVVYEVDVDLSNMLIKATILFLSFFLSYFAFIPSCRLLMKRESWERLDTDFGKCYALTLLSTMALYEVINQCLPIMEPVMAFAPVYTAYVSFKGIKTLKLPEENLVTSWVLSAVFVIATPIVFMKLFTILFLMR